jgi:uncharacterized SAM-binding protein YcdF (DUF218 family)
LNSLFSMLGIETWKPILTALLLPPVPFLLLILVGARLILPRRGLGWFVIVLSVVGIWLSACTGSGRLIEQFMLHVPAPASSDRIAEWRSEARAKGGSLAIVVLGGGAEPIAPEYGVTNLAARSLERLRYGLWLSRETGMPVAFSGGVGWAQAQSGSEAEAAARIAAQDFNRPLKWTETESRDTRENAGYTVPLLKRAGVTHLVLVTHGWHMPRAKRAFDELATINGMRIDIAPMGLARRVDIQPLDWLPTPLGYQRTQTAMREWFGLVLGA